MSPTTITVEHHGTALPARRLGHDALRAARRRHLLGRQVRQQADLRRLRTHARAARSAGAGSLASAVARGLASAATDSQTMNRTLDEMAKAVVEPDWPDLDQAGYEALPTGPPDGGGYFRGQD